MYAPADGPRAVKFSPWPTMPRKLLDNSPHSARNDPPAEGPGERPIRYAVSSADTPLSLCDERECYRIPAPNPVALRFESVSGFGRPTLPAAQGKAQNLRQDIDASAPGASSVVHMGRLPPETLSARRRRIALEKATAQAEAHARAKRDGVNALGHSEETQREVGLAVLMSAYAAAVTETGVVQHPRVYCLEAGGGSIGGHYALRLLGHLEPRPYSQREVLAVLGQGITDAGGTLPPPPKALRKRTGPKLRWGPPSQAEVERRRALLAAAQQERPPVIMLATASGNWCPVEPKDRKRHAALLAALLEKVRPLLLLAPLVET